MSEVGLPTTPVMSAGAPSSLPAGAPSSLPAGAPSSLTIDLVHTEPETRAVASLLARVWAPADGDEPISSELVRALAHTGNYVAVARVDGAPVGAAVAFRARDPEGDYLHSHIAGVVPKSQGSSIGFALKCHQREWALERGLTRVGWTFDPLVARNAYFNVAKLGAEITDYLVDFYGPMNDSVNAGDKTDRCIVTWSLTSARTVAAIEGQARAVDVAALRAAGVEDALLRGNDGRPVRLVTAADLRILEVPADIVALRHVDPRAAAQWRVTLRKVLTEAFAEGLRVSGVSRDSRYVLERPSADR